MKETPKQTSKVLILTGHSGAGKDTVSAAIQAKLGVLPIIPHSTRKMRVGESEGNPYYFTDVSTFTAMVDANKFIEHKSYVTQFAGFEDTAYYGTAFTSIPTDKMSIITIGVLAAIELKEKLGDRAVLVYLHVDDAVREIRAIERGSFDKIEWDNRLAQDHERFKNGLPKGIDITINNMQPLDMTVEEILNKLKD